MARSLAGLIVPDPLSSFETAELFLDNRTVIPESQVPGWAGQTGVTSNRRSTDFLSLNFGQDSAHQVSGRIGIGPHPCPALKESICGLCLGIWASAKESRDLGCHTGGKRSMFIGPLWKVCPHLGKV